MSFLRWMPLLPALLLFQGCFVRHEYFRAEPNILERGHYQWLSQRYNADVLHKYLNLTFHERRRYFDSLVRESEDGRRCLDDKNRLEPLRGAPPHCVLLWFPDPPSWTAERALGADTVEIREFTRRDRLWHVFIGTDAVVGWRVYEWKTPIPGYWQLRAGPADSLVSARDAREGERERFREQSLNAKRPLP